MWALKVKTAFEEQGEQQERRVEKQDQSCQTDMQSNPELPVATAYLQPRPNGGNGAKKEKLHGDRKKGKAHPVAGILRTRPMTCANPDRKVRFKEAAVLPNGKVSRHTSTEGLAPEVQRAASAPPSARTGRKHFAANVSMPQKSGVGQISLQMSDFYRPGMTKTMSVNYASSILSQNSRILSEDLIRLSNKKDVARQAFVKRTERRLRILRKNRELREQTKVERDRRARMDDDQAENGVESAYFRQPETTLLARLSADMDELLTTSEKKEFRKDRIKERTMLLPENYRTANYIKEFGDAQAKTVSNAAYLRGSEEEGTGAEEVTIDVLRL